MAVLIPVGPDAGEQARLEDLLDSIEAFEPHAALRVIAVDDHPEPRRFPDRIDLTVRTGLWDHGRVPDRHSAMVAGTLDGLRAAAGCDWALKLDTDALVIRPFVTTVGEALEGQGVAGAFTTRPDSLERDFSWWRPRIRRAWWPLQVRRVDGRLHLRGKSVTRGLEARRLLRAAKANGYRVGDHCLGGGYAVSGALLARAELLRWEPWVGTGLSEDIVVGVLAGAAGVSLAGRTGRDEPFGVTWSTLPAPPAALISDGHSIVHAVRDQSLGTEAELRAWFRADRRRWRDARE